MIRIAGKTGGENQMKKAIHYLFGGVAALASSLLLAAVNLNTATVEELKTLPGIGPAKAAAIVEYRSQNGNFKSVDEVKKVKGIGEGVFNKLKDEATVAAPAKPAKSAAPIKK